MISIGFQFDCELNSKNHSKKITKILDVVWILFGFFWIVFRFVLDFFLDFLIFLDCFFDFSIFFDFFSISIGFHLDFFLKFDFFDFFDFFLIFFDFLDFFRFQLDFNLIVLDFNWISIGFFNERWRSDKPEKKEQSKKKKKIQNPFFFGF